MCEVLWLYIAGGLLAVGMIIGDIISIVAQDIKNSYGVLGKIKTICFQLVQAIFFISIAFIFSWMSVGFIYIKNKRG